MHGTPTKQGNLIEDAIRALTGDVKLTNKDRYIALQIIRDAAQREMDSLARQSLDKEG